MATCRMIQFQPLADAGNLCFSQVDPDVLAGEAQAFFTSRGYRLEEGTPLFGMYGKGNAALRAIFGGFVKRYKFQVAVAPQAPYVWLQVKKGMSGAMGGMIGYSRMKKETAAVLQGLQAYFSSSS